MNAFKVFNVDWTCRGYQYKVGETYEMKVFPSLCTVGFHACKRIIDCFSYYSFDPKNKVAEVELLGQIVGQGGDKQVTNKIKILKEITWEEVLRRVNLGEGNSGYMNSGNMNSGNRNSGYMNSGNMNSGNRNSGNRNSGNRNSGYMNSGDMNSGYMNSGYMNSGNRNSGYMNSGNRNSGNMNSGNRNSGNRNSGDMNSGNFHTGYFNSEKATMHYIFNTLVTTDEKIQFENSVGFRICRQFKLITYRVRTKTGKYGDYQHMTYKQSWKILWNTLSIVDKNSIREMPFFNSIVFEEITGIKIKI